MQAYIALSPKEIIRMLKGEGIDRYTGYPEEGRIFISMTISFLNDKKSIQKLHEELGKLLS